MKSLSGLTVDDNQPEEEAPAGAGEEMEKSPVKLQEGASLAAPVHQGNETEGNEQALREGRASSVTGRSTTPLQGSQIHNAQTPPMATPKGAIQPES